MLPLRSLLRVSPFLFLLGGQERYEFTEVHMGMPVRVVVYAGTDSVARSAARAAFRRIAELDDTFSDYRAQSEARRLGDRAGAWVAVSPAMFEVLAKSVKISRMTDGAFDVTAAPVVKLWRAARQSGVLPPDRAIDSARSLVGWRRIALDSARRRIRLAPGTTLDFGGIAKGYIIGQALKVIGNRPAMIEAGGDIVTGDPPPGTAGWSIDLGDRVETFSRAAISTSGPAAQFVVISGKRYSHVVDPRTGWALSSSLQAIAIGTDAAMTDAAATAVGVLGPEGTERFPSLRMQIGPAPRLEQPDTFIGFPKR